MPRRDNEREGKISGIESLDRSIGTSSRTSSILSRRDRPSSRTSRTQSTTYSSSHRRDSSSTAGAESTPPRILSSPSVGSSFGLSTSSVLSPLRKEVEIPRASSGTPHTNGTTSSSNVVDPVRAGKQELAKRLSFLAQRLTYGDSMEELAALGSQVQQIEQALGGGMSGSGLLGTASPSLRDQRHRPMSFQTPMRHTRSDMDGGVFFSSPESSVYRSHHSDLSPSLSRHPHEESEEEEQPPPKKGMTAQQADKVISEMLKLNEELAAVVKNLSARQEESDHIHKLLIERAERAAQRIIFLQNRIKYLEDELQENDHELQHLRVSLKQIEIQMPRHPDVELQRCFAAIKEDYQALKRKRAHRSNMVSHLGYDQAIAAASPTRLK